MFEVMYREPPDSARDRRIAAIVARHGGEITYYESPEPDAFSRSVVLTCEFDGYEHADAAVVELRRAGEYVEGPTDY